MNDGDGDDDKAWRKDFKILSKLRLDLNSQLDITSWISVTVAVVQTLYLNPVTMMRMTAT